MAVFKRVRLTTDAMWLCHWTHFPPSTFSCVYGVHSILFHFHNCHTNSTTQDTLYPWHASKMMLLFVYALCVCCINIYCTNNKVINSANIHIITMTIRHAAWIHVTRCSSTQHFSVSLQCFKLCWHIFWCFHFRIVIFLKGLKSIHLNNFSQKPSRNSRFPMRNFFNLKKWYSVASSHWLHPSLWYIAIHACIEIHFDA